MTPPPQDRPTGHGPGARLRAALRALRISQWVKNLLVFLPPVMAHRYTEMDLMGRAALALAAFSLCASAVYVLNDVRDVEADRHHPTKCRRPFASGALPLAAGWVLVPLLLIGSLGFASPLPRSFLVVLAVYLGLTTLYSFFLKERALVDVLLLAGLYTLRIIAGAAATGVPVSEWLLGFSMFLFLSLAAVKRYAELGRLRSDPAAGSKIRGRGYLVDDLELIVQIGLCSGLIAVLVLALYISGEAVTELYASPEMLWFVCPLMLFWIMRIWLLAHRSQMDDDPLSFAMRDRTTWAIALIGVAVMAAAERGW